MRVRERCGELDLASESLDAYRGCHLRWQNFDDDASAERIVVADEDARHARADELTLEGVGAAQSITEIQAELGIHASGE